MQARFLPFPGVLLALALAAASPAQASRGPQASSPEPSTGRGTVPGVVNLKLRESLKAGRARKSTGLAEVDALLRSHGLVDLAPLMRGLHAPGKPGGTDLTRVYGAHYAGGAAPRTVAGQLAGLAGIEYAEPQYTYRLDVTPNDQAYSTNQAQYLSRMHFPQAWDTTKGEQGNAVVADVDGGTDWTHPDLRANIWTNPGEIAGNGIDDDHNGYVDDVRGWNFANDTNDPRGLNTAPGSYQHGTHTAGIVCAVANNSMGIAGASWNAKLMPICAASASPMGDLIIQYGYQGIIYAAENGADIVNASWGGGGAASSFERDVVEFAWEHNTVICAAAGNGGVATPHYPSSFPHVLSVANVNSFDVKASSSNYGLGVDVSAQGVSILSTFPIGGFGTLTGTSMSSPHAAAVCALVKTRWPGYTPDQVMERVRVTSDNIDAANPAFVGQLGYGRVNAEAALTHHANSVRITNVTIADQDGDGIIEPGETVSIALTVTSWLSTVSNLNFSLSESSSFVTVTNGNASLASLDSLQSAALPVLTLHVEPNAPIQHDVQCTLAISSTSPTYNDKDYFEFTILPQFVNVDANNVHTTVTSVGKLGFLSAGGSGTAGIGFEYKGSGNLLFEGGMLIGTDVNHISDGARDASGSSQDNDFATVPGGVPSVQRPGPQADLQTGAAFNDSVAPAPLGVRVHQDTYQFANDPNADYLLLKYTIRNASGSPLNGLRVGWFFDWDIDGNTATTNKTAVDLSRNLGYAWDTSGAGPTSYVGTRVLTSPGLTAYHAIWNDQSDPRNPTWGLYDGFSNDEKWECLLRNGVTTTAGPADVSNALATGPFNLAPGDSVVVGFAVLGGDDLPALRANADAAQHKWDFLQTGTPVELFDLEAAQDGGDVVVRWRTRREERVAAFRVYRGRDGAPLEPLRPDLVPSPSGTYAFRDPGVAPDSYVYRVGEVSPGGAVVLHGEARIEVARAVPLRTFLDAGVPNPFNPSTALRFGVSQAGPGELVIYDARGQHVRTLWRAPRAEPGFYRLVWDGRDDGGRRAASGQYLARLVVSGRAEARRLTLVK